MSSLRLFVCLFYISQITSASSNGCDIFRNRFTVQDGVFQDVCGAAVLSPQSVTYASEDDIYQPESFLTIDPTINSSIFEDAYRYAIVIEASVDIESDSYSTILAGDSFQISYAYRNQICINGEYVKSSCNYYSNGYTESCSKSIEKYSKCINAWDADVNITEFHTIILYQRYGTLKLYLNNYPRPAYISFHSEDLIISVSRIAGSYDSYSSSGNIYFKSIMISTYRWLDPEDIWDYL